MLATYGLRPHELDDCEFIDLKHRLKVPDDTKTGFRVVVPLHRDWVELFELRSERRTGQDFKGQRFSRHKSVALQSD